MTIASNKITAFTKKVADLADHPALGNTALLKQWFDSSPEELRVALDSLIDGLAAITDGDSGADNIGATAISGLTGATVQALLESMKTFVDTKSNTADTYTQTQADAKFETIIELTTNRKLSATGDFTGTLNGYPIVAADPGLSSTVAALKADNAYNVKDAGCPNNDTSDCGVILNALVGKNYIYFPEGTYRFTNTWVISGDFTSVIFHPKAKIHVVGNINAITISGNYCKVYGGEIYSDGTALNNGRYGIEVDGSYCVVEKTYIHDITYSAIFNNGKYNTFRDNVGKSVGWDAGSNYTNSVNGKWFNCRAIQTGRHGFSTDPGAQLIDFDGCYTEDIGNPADNQGHDPYHFEGCTGGNVINCISKWTANSPYVTNAGLSSVRLGIRISNSYRIIVNGLRVVIDSGFVPLDTARVFNWCYVESTSLANNTFFMRNVVVTNNSNFVTKAYLGVNSSLELEKCHFYGYVSVKQESVSGAMRCLKDCFIDGVDKTYYFYDHPYQTIGFEASNNVIKNSKGLINGGQLINGLIEKNVIDSCYDGILLGRYSGNVCLNTIIRQNYIKTIDHYAIQGSFNATPQQIKIVDNLFDGVISSLFVGEGGGCNALWKNNNPGSTLAVTTLVTGTATSILADMTSNYDVVRDGATVRPANPDTSGATLAALETEVNEIKAVMRIARLIF